jgi:hypothetical protein
MIDGEKPEICRQVWDRSVEGRDVMEDTALAAHVGSCMSCFRTLAELRDAPRLAAALRADAPAVPASDRFWDDLAARTTAAASAALVDNKRRPIRRATGIAAIVVAAAAAWVLFAGRAPVVSPTASGSVATTAGGEEEEAVDEGAVDIQDLDEPALQRLLARLRTQAPAPAVSALAAASDAQEAADAVLEDDVNEALAELDGAALLRVERSLAGASL